MKKRRISENVFGFVAAHIDSVHTLDVLLLLFADHTRFWTAEAVHERIKSSLSAVETSLHRLVSSGLARKAIGETPLFQYWPSTTALASMTAELVGLYAERSTAVIEVIYSRPARITRGFARLLEGERKPKL